MERQTIPLDELNTKGHSHDARLSRPFAEVASRSLIKTAWGSVEGIPAPKSVPAALVGLQPSALARFIVVALRKAGTGDKVHDRGSFTDAHLASAALVPSVSPIVPSRPKPQG